MKLKEKQREKVIPYREKKTTVFLWYVMAAILILLILILAKSTIEIGTESVKQSYQDAKDKASDEAYDNFYNKGYKDGWDTYHVTNKAVIDIGQIQAESKLEVLTVYDVAYEVPRDDKSDNLISKLTNVIKTPLQTWLEVPVKGTFVINMKMAEFVVDEARQYVLIRVLPPEIDDKTFGIDGENVKLLYVEQGGILKDDAKSGVERIRGQLDDAKRRIRLKVENDQSTRQSAKKSTVKILTALVKKMNSDIPDLQVEIQFIDE